MGIYLNLGTVIRECPAGKGFVDIAYIPLKDKPAMLVELNGIKI